MTDAMLWTYGLFKEYCINFINIVCIRQASDCMSGSEEELRVSCRNLTHGGQREESN